MVYGNNEWSCRGVGCEPFRGCDHFSWTVNHPLFDIKPCGLHTNGHGEVFLTLCFGLVDGHVDAIETRMGSWKYLMRKGGKGSRMGKGRD